MYTKLNLSDWNRRELFDFFSTFEEPYFGITTAVDVTKAYNYAKAAGYLFFTYYLHKSLMAVNQISVMKYRIQGPDVIHYDDIHASATINREDGTFGFSFIVFDNAFQIFEANTQAEIIRIRSSRNLFPTRNGDDCIHYSSLPWIDFTSLSHARSYRTKDSVPKISFGKMTEQGGRLHMPCSVHAHHGLVDGKDVGEYFEIFQQLLDENLPPDF